MKKPKKEPRRKPKYGLIQLGSHDSLVAEEGGKYRELWHAQAQYYEKA